MYVSISRLVVRKKLAISTLNKEKVIKYPVLRINIVFPASDGGSCGLIICFYS